MLCSNMVMRWRNFFFFALFCLIFSWGGIAYSSDDVSLPKEDTETPSWLYVIRADRATLAEGNSLLALEGIDPDILAFTDRPYREHKIITWDEFAELWGEGEGSFADVPPNVVLSGTAMGDSSTHCGAEVEFLDAPALYAGYDLGGRNAIKVPIHSWADGLGYPMVGAEVLIKVLYEGAAPRACRPMEEVSGFVDSVVTTCACSNFGVNIFGLSGGWGVNQEAMIKTLIQTGVRKFRVNNIGGWPDRAYEAINQETGKLSQTEQDKVSVYVPSQYFVGPNFSINATKNKFSGWPNIKHWVIQLDACNPVDTSSPVYCSNPTEAGLSRVDLAAYEAQIHQAVPAFQGQSYSVEFVIPYQDESASPQSVLAQVKKATVDAFPGVRFTLEKTEYPFWVGSTSTDFPVDQANAFDQFAKSNGFAGGTFAETGWPSACPKNPATASLTNECAFLKSLIQGSSGFSDAKFVAYWWLMGAEDVNDGCGPDSWGLFDPSGSFKCPGSF